MKIRSLLFFLTFSFCAFAQKMPSDYFMEAIQYGLLQIEEDEYLYVLDKVIAQKSRSLHNEKNDYHRKAKIVKHLTSRGFEMGIIVKRLDFSDME